MPYQFILHDQFDEELSILYLIIREIFPETVSVFHDESFQDNNLIKCFQFKCEHQTLLLQIKSMMIWMHFSHKIEDNRLLNNDQKNRYFHITYIREYLNSEN